MEQVSKPILLVEDEPEVRSLLKLMLEQSGFEVVVANNGIKAFHELRKRRGEIALLVTDVDMGHMNGMELAASVGFHLPGVPILVVSGLPIPLSELDVVAPGAVLLTKPFSADTLTGAVRKLVGPAD